MPIRADGVGTPTPTSPLEGVPLRSRAEHDATFVAGSQLMPSWPIGSRPTTPVSPRSRTMAGAHRIPRSSSSGSHSALRRRRRSAYLRWRWRRAPSHSRFVVERDPQRSADGGARPTFAGDGGGRIASRGRRRTGPAARSADGARPTLAGDGGGPIASHVRRRTGATARSADGGARPTFAGDGGGPPSHILFPVVVESEPCHSVASER